MNKKGFTLLELLAVIVVLAIIALIVTPFVTKAIEEAKKGSAENSMNGLISAAEAYYGTELVKNGGSFDNITFTFNNGTITKSIEEASDLTFKGSKPTSGTVTITDNGVVTLTNIQFGGYYFNGTNKTSITTAKEVTLLPGLYLTNTSTLAKVEVNGEEVDATWENIKLAYPDAFVTTGSIVGDTDEHSSYFYDLEGDLVIGSDITSIGEGAFFNCFSLTSITIPNSVTSIGAYAFSACYRLTNITVDENNPNYKSIAGVLFNKSGTTLIQYPIAKEGNTYTVPNSVTSIGAYAFSITNLTSVAIPNSVTSIGEGAFFGCENLTSVTIPNSVTSIGDYAFNDCPSLTNVTIPTSVTSIGEEAFSYCSNLTSIIIPNGVTSIGENAFSGVPKVIYNGTATGTPWGATLVTTE